MTTQQTIDDANTKLAAAQAAYNLAISNEASYRASMVDLFNDIHCKYEGVIYLGQVANRNNCKQGNVSQNPGCASKSTCETKIDNYNTAVGNYNSSIPVTSNKKVLLDAAQSFRDNVIRNAQNDPTFIAQQQQNSNAAILAQKQIDEQKSRNRNIAIAVVVIAIVIVSAVLIWKRIK